MVKATLDVRKLQRKLGITSAQLKLELREAFQQILQQWEAFGQDRISGGYPRTSSTQGLVNRSGALRRGGLGIEVTGTEINSLRGEGQIRLKYGVTQEYGGTIRPRNGKFLTIPLPAALDPSGIARFSARDLPRDETFVLRPREDERNRAYIVRRTPDGLQYLFVLVRSVKVPARWGLRDLWKSGKMNEVRMEEVGDAIRRTVIKARRAG